MEDKFPIKLNTFDEFGEIFDINYLKKFIKNN